MKAKRLLSLLLTAALMLSMMTPVLAASAETELPRASQTRLEETNEVVSIRLQATGKLVYGSPFELSVVTRPADAQYIGVVLGIKGEAKGYVTLVLSDKLRTLLKMIPLPRKMSKTPDQVEEFNVYAYVKQLIDGNDVSVLLGVADEVVKVMDTLKFYIPTLKDMSMGLKLSLELIRRYLPEGAFSRIYLDEQPVDSGSYIAGAVALESGDLNTAGVAMFKIKPKTEGVRLYWAEDLPAGMTLAEAEAHNVGALLESDGVVVDNAKVTCTYKRRACSAASPRSSRRSRVSTPRRQQSPATIPARRSHGLSLSINIKRKTSCASAREVFSVLFTSGTASPSRRHSSSCRAD